MNKSELRRVYLEKRRALSTIDMSEKSRQIADRFFVEFDLKVIETLHCFISIPRLSEIDTSLIYQRICADFPLIQMVAPRMSSVTGEIESLNLTSETELLENSWGIREPVGNEIIDPTEIDAVLVPVLCFDRKGNRIGYGKGFYDRFLAKCRPNCRKIGLSFVAPVDQIADIAEHDVPLDQCFTPDRSYAFPRGR
ncbi:5-formyltetrahydrofolate cyclo-ligase [soil metagenome]